MADQLKIDVSSTFLQASPPQSYTLLSVSDIVLPTGYNHGRIIISAGASNQKIADQVNIFLFKSLSTDGIDLKVASTGATAMDNVSYFSYHGSKTDFYVSNAGTESITLEFVTGIYA